MSNNSFLSNYGKNMDEPGVPTPEVIVQDADLGYKYEEKSGFKKVEPKGTGGYMARRPTKLLIPIIAAGVVVLGIIITLVLLLGGGVKVIELVNRPFSDAQLWATENGVNLTKVEEYNDVYGQGIIIEQSIPAGETFKKGELLTLTVSLGPDLSVMLELPDLMSMTLQQIEAWRDKNFMSKVRIATENSDTVPAGKVIRFEINDDTVVKEIRRDTPVYIIVSKGPKDESSVQVTVPDFKTMSISEAYIFANENGITLVVEDQFDDYVPRGSVISQSVKAQEKIAKGSEIKLVVSKGKLIEVPDFSDYTKEQAASLASELGIPVTVIEKYSGSKAGAFLSQSIAAGTTYISGEYLELYYSIGNKIALASFVGQTRDSIESWANELNKQGASIAIKVSTTKSSQPSGTIIYQDPANKLINVKTTVSVTVSLGKIIYVPDFVDKTDNANRGYDTAITREEAIAMCEAAGLVPVFEKAASFNANKLPGEIISQGSNYPGKEVAEGSKITLTYNPIRQTDIVTVDDFIDMTKDEINADPVLNPTNMYHKKFTIIFEGEGAVIAQSIAKGSKVNQGTVIILTLA
jgi:serine/threonine-protein kinase